MRDRELRKLKPGSLIALKDSSLVGTITETTKTSFTVRWGNNTTRKYVYNFFDSRRVTPLYLEQSSEFMLFEIIVTKKNNT